MANCRYSVAKLGEHAVRFRMAGIFDMNEAMQQFYQAMEMLKQMEWSFLVADFSGLAPTGSSLTLGSHFLAVLREMAPELNERRAHSIVILKSREQAGFVLSFINPGDLAENTQIIFADDYP